MIKAERDEFKTQLAEANKKLSDTGAQVFEKEIASLKEKVSNLETSLATATKSVTDLTAENKSLADQKTSLEAEVATAKKIQLTTERTSALVSVGAPEDEAKAIVAKFENVSAEQFTSMVDLIKDKWAKSGSAEEAEKKTEEEFKKAGKAAKQEESKKEEDQEDKMMKDCKADKVVETAKAEADAPLGVTDTDKLESTRSSIIDWMNDNRGKSNKK